MLSWDELQKHFFYVIEGRKLGNGKSLFGCYVAFYYRLEYQVAIASNMSFNGIDYIKLETEEQLFREIKNCLIILDEMDINTWYESREDARIYQQELMKHCRKNNNVVIFITQDVSLIPKKMRNLFQVIGHPEITHRFNGKRNIEFRGNIYNTDISPDSEIIVQFYRYEDDFHRPHIRKHLWIPIGEIITVKYLYWYFSKYDTNERIERLEPIMIESRKRKKKEKENED